MACFSFKMWHHFLAVQFKMFIFFQSTHFHGSLFFTLCVLFFSSEKCTKWTLVKVNSVFRKQLLHFVSPSPNPVFFPILPNVLAPEGDSWRLHFHLFSLLFKPTFFFKYIGVGFSVARRLSIEPFFSCCEIEKDLVFLSPCFSRSLFKAISKVFRTKKIIRKNCEDGGGNVICPVLMRKSRQHYLATYTGRIFQCDFVMGNE